MNKKIFAILLSLCMVLGLVAGCSKTTEETTEAETTVEETTEETTSEEVEETEAEVEVSDLRVVSLSPEITEIICALGAEDVLVGRSTYCDYPESVFEIPAVGDLYAMDVEAIAAVEPTVVLASGFIDEDTVAALEEFGIEVMVLTEGTTIDGMFDLISEVASIVDKEDEAEDLIADTIAQFDEISAEATDVSVYYVVGYGEYGDYTADANTFINDIIVTAGGVNAGAAAENWYISLEDLIAADPDIIIISEWMYDDFIATAPYSDLTAVTSGNVISVDANLFERQTPRNVEAVEIVANAIADFVEAADEQAA